MKTIDLSGKPFHFIGIGGIGMSALAYILAKRHIPVSGSDLRVNHITERLESVGARIFSRQEDTNLDIFQSTANQRRPLSATVRAQSFRGSSGEAKSYLESLRPQVVCSTAISASNVEYQAAVERGYEIFHRSDLLAALIQSYHSIAVAGTHGKTTTSSLIAYMLLKAGLDPTIIIGGEVEAWQGNARLGQSRLLVAEADESDGSLVKHTPTIGVVTNVELDHPDHYQTLEDVVAIFRRFAAQSQTLVGCIDDEIVQELQPDISYSLKSAQKADYWVTQVRYHSQGSTAQVWERGQLLGRLQLPLLGQHNLSNALAAVAVGRQVSLGFEEIASAIATFKGAKRRFEIKGECHGITFVDDYAHHPSEIAATLAAARQQRNAQRTVAIFQPHRYSRTVAFLDEFATAFSDADRVIVTDIYSAGEVNPGRISGQQVAEEIARHHPQVCYHSFATLKEWLSQELKPGDLALFLGAGNLNQVIPTVMAACSSQNQ
ncbi:MAG: UDP-N-acetylmuramate--L-alanine ligase [Cyanophyceae cyanobacterium]